MFPINSKRFVNFISRISISRYCFATIPHKAPHKKLSVKVGRTITKFGKTDVGIATQFCFKVILGPHAFTTTFLLL